MLGYSAEDWTSLDINEGESGDSLLKERFRATGTRLLKTLFAVVVWLCVPGLVAAQQPANSIRVSQLPQDPFFAVYASPTIGLPAGLSYGEFTWLGPVENTLEPISGSIGKSCQIQIGLGSLAWAATKWSNSPNRFNSPL